MKKIALIILILISTNTFSQKKLDFVFGTLTTKDLKITKYDKDTTANALVLYESGNSYFKVKDRNIVIETIYYYKIKIFNTEGFDQATFSIPIYNNKSNHEKVVDIKGITHNGYKTYLNKSNIFTNRVNEHWKNVKFTMPNLKEGSIIEVAYTLVTPFKFNLTGWDFQSNIPKLVSDYKASIPGNYVYNRHLVGYLKLHTNSSTIKKDCFRVPAYTGSANCENVHYRMEDIPAFIEEDYMTSKDNFISKIKFELKYTKWFDGKTLKYTTTWAITDKKFKSNRSIGTQLKKTKYFEELLPADIKSIPKELDRAKAVYTFIKDYFTWNEEYSIFNDVKIKEAIENKTGNVGEINISLINALKSVNLNAELLLLSTRDNGFPTKLHPVMTDFNYVVAKLNINNKVYLLDATDKLKPFSELPYRCLNSFGRVMNFENESYWFDIKSQNNSKTVEYAQLILNENGNIKGVLRRVHTGFNAYNKRKSYIAKTNDEIMTEFEDEFSNLTVENYTLINKNDIEKPLIEIFEIVFDYEDNINKIYFNPFFGGRFEENPFKQEKRMYPVDFGYQKKYILHFSLELPDGYKIESAPPTKILEYGDKILTYSLKSRNHEDYKYTLYSNLTIGKALFYNREYNPLKEIFKQTIISQKTPLVIVKNINP